MNTWAMGQTQGHELPYSIDEKHNCLNGKTIWSVHAGKKKATGEPVTVFVFDFTDKSPDKIKLAQSAHLRLKTLRHPNILKYIDGIELPNCIYVVTEEAIPLEEHLDSEEGRSKFSTTWGLHQTIKAVGFLNIDCGLVHRNVCMSSVFVDGAGEWKLAGVEFMVTHGDSGSAPPKSLEVLRRYDPPEMGKSAAARKAEKWSCDMWGLGCLVWEIYNGPLPQVASLRNTNKIPKPLVPHYCEMVSANPKSRPNPNDLLSRLREHGGFLANQYVSIALRIEEVQTMEPTQRNEFFTELNKHLNSFPKNFSKHKILPQLLNAFEFGGAGSAVLAPLFKLSQLLDNAEYQKKIVPCVVKLFSSNDRATRLNLLQQMEHFIDHLQQSTISNQIFPQIANGFSDTVPLVREQTIKSMVLLAPKLSDSVLNNQLLKHFAKCQLDEQPSIRTNVNICLGKIAQHLSPATRQKVLVTAFLRAMKDPFPPARSAAIGSLAATHGYYTTGDISSRILPALCTLTVDKEKSVRDQVFTTIKMFLGKMEKISEDPQAAAEQEKAETEAANSSSWTGWAMSSLTSKFYKSSAGTGTTAPQAPPTTAAGATPTTGSVDTKRGEQKQVGGLKLGEGKKEAAADISEGWEDEEWEDFTTVPKPGELDSFQTSSGERRREEDRGGSFGGGGGGWDEEVMAANDGSDMEGWGEEDGWGDFGEKHPPSSKQKQKSLSPPPPQSSGADFFDTFQGNLSSNKPKEKDYFSDFGVMAAPSSSSSSSLSAKREKSPPPPVSATLFGSTGGGERKSESGGSEGWGDWGSSNFGSMKPQSTASQAKSMKLGAKTTTESSSSFSASSKALAPSSPSSGTGGEGEGWDFDNADWGSFDTEGSKTGSAGTGSSSSSARQELQQKRREERKLKQQAAREKRAAGMSLKPGLGAVKKD